MSGQRLTFHLAGINNQNFLMRDEETGSYWQQISGQAIAGPLRGRQLQLILSDELTFGTWRTEQPDGMVLQDSPKFVAEYAPKDWDVKMRKQKTVVQFEEQGMKARDLVLGIQAFGASRAYPLDQVLAQKLVLDRVGTEPVILAVGADGESVRAFRGRAAVDYYRLPSGRLVDSVGGSEWNFQGCAETGPDKGTCLERVAMLKDYWFDWRGYNPKTTIWRQPGK